MERTVILYHGNCPDGFGGAYAAWKKFGDSAEYVGLKHQKPAPENLAGAHLYFIDFCYPKEIMDTLIKEAASVTVLDHHEGVKEIVEAMPEFVYDVNRSGATIAWNYFHPDTKAPRLLEYVTDGDLYRFTLPDSRAFLAYIYVKEQDFAVWDALIAEAETEEGFTRFIELGRIYSEHFAILVDKIVERSKLVTFEGRTVYLASGAEFFTSDAGHKLARMQPPFALMAQVRPEGLRISLRGDGSVNVAEIAQKYGGNGHPNAAAFSLSWNDPIPWTPIPDEDQPENQ